MSRFWDALGHPPAEGELDLEELAIGAGQLLSDAAAPTEALALGAGQLLSDAAAPTEAVIITNV